MPLQASEVPPRWARVLDLICLILVAVAIIVAISGGFRARFGGWRLALTSPYRILLWAAIAAVVRHLAVPGGPIYRDLPARVIRALKMPAATSARTVLFGTRPAVLFVGYMAVFMFGYRDGRAPYKMFENEFANLQVRWDAGWYLGIAIDGYQYDAEHAQDQQDIVFFPAYPLIVRAAARLLGGSLTALMIGGTLVSLAAFFGALVYLFRFARDTLEEEDQARAALWFLAAFPFALFYSAIYTESLFLVTAVAAFDHFRRGELWRGAAWGLLAGLTRPNGCFLALPFAVLAVSPRLPAWLVGATSHKILRPVPALAAVSAPVAGVLLYSAFTWQLTGQPFAWARGQVAWGREYRGLSALVLQHYQWLTQGTFYEYTKNVPGDMLNASGALFVLATAWPVARRLGLAYAVFILINVLPPLAAGGLLSAGRLSSVMFPSFVWLGRAVPPRYRPAWVGSFMALQAFNAALFYTWRPLF